LSQLSLVPSPVELLKFFLSIIVVLLRLQSNLLGGFHLILRGFCAILRGLCVFFDLLEQHHRLQHTRCMYNSCCLGINGGFFGNSLNAPKAMTILQTFSQLL
jgi:hypothetical protein